MHSETLQLERLVDDVEIRRTAAKTLKGFCLTYLPHHFPADLSDFFDEIIKVAACGAVGPDALGCVVAHPFARFFEQLDAETPDSFRFGVRYIDGARHQMAFVRGARPDRRIQDSVG
jgi:hypothetical protein